MSNGWDQNAGAFLAVHADGRAVFLFQFEKWGAADGLNPIPHQLSLRDRAVRASCLDAADHLSAHTTKAASAKIAMAPQIAKDIAQIT